MGVVDDLQKAYARLKEEGLEAGAKSVLKEAATRVVHANREVILLRLDLKSPKAHRTKKEIEKYQFRLVPFGPDVFPDVVRMLEASEPGRIPQIQKRIDENTPGWVAYEDGEVVAYVFYEYDAPGRAPYPDLQWLGVRLRDGEVYSFDSFIPVALRGRGIPVFRATYQALHEAGFTVAYGYVWAWDTAPLWSYRVTGWEEIHRFTEHRILGRFAIVGGVLYRLNRFDRERVVALPFGDRLHPS